MSLTAAAGISAIGGLASGIMGSKSSAKAAKKQMEFQLLMQQQQRKWEKEKMLNSHQWEMQDLKNAGLNPALTATGGQGAQGGSIGMGQGAMADTSGYSAGANSLLNGINAMINSARTETQIKNETARTEAETAKTMAETGKIATESGLLNKYGAKEIGAKIEALNASSALNAKQQNQTGIVLGNLTKEGVETVQKGIGNAGEFIADILSGGDKTAQKFQERLQKAYQKRKTNSAKKQMNSAKTSKEAWKNIL